MTLNLEGHSIYLVCMWGNRFKEVNKPSFSRR